MEILRDIDLDQSMIGSTFIDFKYFLKFTLMDDDLNIIMQNDALNYKKTIDKYFTLSEESQRLYLRLFLRTTKWFRLTRKDNKYLLYNESLLKELERSGNKNL